nr:hypothetical protein [Pyxidicoccus caerfyrddinensis]
MSQVATYYVQALEHRTVRIKALQGLTSTLASLVEVLGPDKQNQSFHSPILPVSVKEDVA